MIDASSNSSTPVIILSYLANANNGDEEVIIQVSLKSWHLY